MMHTKLLRLGGAVLVGLLAFLSACAVPGSLETPAGKVILHTPYGAQGRAVDGGYFQSTVLPQNLEAAISSFVVTLSGNPGGPLTQTVSYDQASRFVFENVPHGSWDLKVEGLSGSSQVVALGLYKGFVTVTDGQVTDIPDLITVSPTRPDSPGVEQGEFLLTLRKVPGAAKTVNLDYRAVTFANDGTFVLTDRLAADPTVLTYSLSLPDPSSGYRTLNVQTDGGDQTGTMLLTLKFLNDDGTLVHTFQPVFTVDLYQNLTSTLDLTLPDYVSNSSTPAAGNLSVTTDVQGNAVVHWNWPLQPNFVTAYQIGKTPTGSNIPPDDSQILATLPNLNDVNSYATNVNLPGEPGRTAQFWVRTISSGLYPSTWNTVTAAEHSTSSAPFDLYVSLSGSNGADGSIATPFATIQKAIDTAQLRQRFGQETRIHVAEGTYNLAAALVNAPRNLDGQAGNEAAVPLSLLGGYYDGFTKRGDPVLHPTILNDTRTTGDALTEYAGIYYNQNQTPALTVAQTIDGFTLQQTLGDQGAHVHSGILLKEVVTATVSYVKVVQTAPLSATGSLTAMSLGANTSLTAGSPRRLTLHHNTIFQNVAATNASPGSYGQTAIELPFNSGTQKSDLTVNLYNTLVVQGATSSSDWSVGLNFLGLQDNNALILRNNTFVSDLTVTADFAAPVRMSSSNHVPLTVENNLFYNRNPAGLGIAFSVAFYHDTNLFRNNVFVDFVYAAARNDVSPPNEITAAQLNDPGTWDNHLSSVDNQGVTYSSVHFTNPPAGNYRLTADTDVAVLNGGLKGANSNPVWPFTDDLAGLTRTGDWTPGAYETDPPFIVNLGASFGTPRATPDYSFPVVADMHAFALADVDGNGLADAIVNIGPSATGIKVYTQAPQETFTLTQELSTLTGGTNFGVYALTVGQLKNNNFPAVVTGGPNGDEFSANAVFDNTSGTFAVNGTTTYTSNGSAFYGFQVATGRLNGDLYDDVVWSTPDKLWVGLSNGSGGFSSLLSYPKSGSGSEVQALVLADLDADGDLDAATTRTNILNGEGSLLMFLNNGTGLFGACVVEPSSASTYYNPHSLAVTDLSGDGKADLLVTNFLGNNTTYPGLDLWIGIRSSADGVSPTYTFHRVSDSFYQLDFGFGKDLQTGDYNQDGTPDFVVASAHGVRLYVSDTPGVWKPTMVTDAANPAAAARFFDLNDDGKLDIVTSANSVPVKVYYQ